MEEGDKNPGLEKDSLHSAPGTKSEPVEVEKKPPPMQTAPPTQYSNVNTNPMPEHHRNNYPTGPGECMLCVMLEL